MEQAIQSVQSFFKRKDVVISAHRYGIDAMGAMAQGLFASLLIGTIIKTLGQQLGLAFLVTAGGYAAAVGPTCHGRVHRLRAARAHAAGAVQPDRRGRAAANELGGAGGPLAVYLIAIIAAEVGKLVSKETKIDILVTPAVTILVGVGLRRAVCAVHRRGGVRRGQPHHVGHRSAAVPDGHCGFCAGRHGADASHLQCGHLRSAGPDGFAGGAAVAGCCAQMVGFAVMSYKENGVGGLVSQGLGTSMLQMPNILRNPRTWIPPTLAAAITSVPV